MQSYDPKGGQQPEAKLQKAFIKFLEARGWWVKATHGSQQQSGVPDLFCTHKKWGHRWIDMKVKGRYRITPAQYCDWPNFCRNGSGVWIIVECTEAEYKKLWEPFNWYTYIPLGKDPERRQLRTEMSTLVKHYHDRKDLYNE